MQYNPIVADRSGEIYGAGQVGAAQMDAQAKINLANQLSQSFGSVVNSYAQYQGDKAKAKVYGEFLDRHGEQLGVHPEWIEQYKQMPFREQIASAELMTGGLGQQLMQGNYLDKKQNYALERMAARQAGGGGGGGSDYVVGQGWQ